MRPKHLLAVILLMLASISANAGFSYKSYDTGNSVIVAVEIADKGIYNMVISANFSNEPYERKPYTTDKYKYFMRHITTEWRGAVLNAVLTNNQYDITDLARVESSANSAIKDLITCSKVKHGIQPGVEVQYSITGIYLVDAND